MTYPLGPASPSPETLRILPGLTPGGTLTLIFFLTRIRPSPLHNEVATHNQKHRRHESSASATTSAATSRSSTATSTASHPSHGPISVREASLKAQEIRPTADVAEWAHQMHLTQGRSYWWCQGCFPREVVEPLHIPKAVEKAMTGRRVRINEPSHCYGICFQVQPCRISSY